MKPFIRITRHPYEEPHLLNLIVEASNGRLQGSLEIYANAEDLSTVAEHLSAFPGRRKEPVLWELGSERADDRFAFHFRFRVFQVNSTGRCAIEFRFNNNRETPDREVIEFSTETQLADIDRLANLLHRFARLDHRVLEWTVTEGRLHNGH